MNCKEIEEQEILERYLLGRLSGSEQEAFEEHYFECASCFSQLQIGLTIQEDLRQHPPASPEKSGATMSRIWTWAPAFITAVLLLVAGIWLSSTGKHKPLQQASSPSTAASTQTSAQPHRSAATLDVLSRVEPVPYSPIALRGAEDDAHEAFRKAMLHYQKGDYAGAIPGLSAAVKSRSRTASFTFYLGVCYLLTGQADAAVQSFQQLASLNDPTYSEQAHFYLAKAYLRRGEVSSAQDELQTTIRLHGTKAGEAEELLHKLSE